MSAAVWVWSGSEQEHAHISPFDHGLTVGDGVFETISVRQGEPIALTRHLDRLTSSLEALGLPAVDYALVHQGITHVMSQAEPDARSLGRLRVTVTGGVGPLGSDRHSTPPTIVVALAPTKPWPATTSAVVVPWIRNERSAIAGAKSTSYAENVVALQWAHEQGYSEGIFLNSRDELCEGTGTNIFCVINGELVTPPLTSGCLAGIARGLVLDWCGGVERAIDAGELASVSEVFLTSSTRDVHPVLQWASPYGEKRWESTGSITAAVAETFAQRLAKDPDPA